MNEESGMDGDKSAYKVSVLGIYILNLWTETIPYLPMLEEKLKIKKKNKKKTKKNKKK